MYVHVNVGLSRVPAIYGVALEGEFSPLILSPEPLCFRFRVFTSLEKQGWLKEKLNVSRLNFGI